MPTTTTTRRAAIAIASIAATAATGTGVAIACGGAAPRASYYVAVGDSLTAGLQPTTGDEKTRGFAGPVAAGLAKQDHSLKLKNFGCSGETTGSMINGGICSYDEGNQLAASTAFMRAHPGRVKAITVTIGANDVLSCVTAAGIDQACLASSFAGIKTKLPTILSGLRKAAPNAELVVLNYYNPMLANYLTGAQGQALATASTDLLAGGNGVIESAAAAAGAEVADVASAFHSTDTTPTAVPGLGTVPANVASICALTWMCTPYKNIHANDAGYAVMAKTVLTTIGKLGAKSTAPRANRAAA